MSDPVLAAENQTLPPPSAPPLSSGRLGQLHKIIAPWGKHIGSKYHGGPGQGDHDHGSTDGHYSTSALSQNTSHRTGIPIAALDINHDGTHAVLAGKDILKTVRVQDGTVADVLNIRAAVGSYPSIHTSPQLEGQGKRREYLPAKDVRWSTKNYGHIIATAATSGRISLYDVNLLNTKRELAWLHEHTNQINKLDFDPFAGYLLLSASQDKSVRLWDLREGTRERSRLRFEPRSPVRDVRWSPTEALDFAICTDGGVIQKWDARSPLGPKLSINGHEKACYAVDWHPDGQHVISGGFDKYIRVWDFQNDNKRQKPVFQLRAPSGIRNIKWRPPCRASETTDSGHWQSTQVAVSYNYDDPRIHIWDLRRPWLPFRELDRYNSAANDLLWASKDKLWTVGDEGVFTQWDLKRSTPFYNELPPCASAFAADGEYYTFAEDREWGPGLGADDPAVGFLSIPRYRLSGGDEPTASRSLTDDEANLETNTSSSHRRLERAVPSSKSTKSQANSPPSVEDKPPVLSLDRAVFQRQDLFNNTQVGAASFIPGVVAEPEIVEFLASNFALPATVEERKQSPAAILDQLQRAFDQNATACETVSMYRMAQTWRILGAVIVPELRDWADSNRAKRHAEAFKRREMLEAFRAGNYRKGFSPYAGLPGRDKNARGETKSTLVNHLLKATVEAERSSNGDSTSNMATPVVKPLPPSPYDRKRWNLASADEEIDDMLPLPPSILHSHSTAAAAARALADSPDRAGTSASSSPVLSKHPNVTPSRSTTSHVHHLSSPKRAESQLNSPMLDDSKVRTTHNSTQEDRRAALRDYRIQARPIFTLESSNQMPPLGPRHSSGESFQMFSASADSSQQARSLGQSFEFTEARDDSHDPSMDTEHDSDHDREERALSFPRNSNKTLNSFTRFSHESTDLESVAATTDTPLDMSFDNSDLVDPKSRLPDAEKTRWTSGRDQISAPTSDLNTALSSTPEIFHFEETRSPHKPRIHTSNPLRSGQKLVNAPLDLPVQISIEELDCQGYLYQDFRPIDLSSYEPQSPFAWSSLPLICQCIAFDIENGIGHSLFSANLLMHVHPYFFDSSFRHLHGVEINGMENIAERLMAPHLGHRIIETLFNNHVSFLKQIELVAPAAVLRKMCVEFKYPMIYAPAKGDERVGGGLNNGDAAMLSIICSTCQGPMSSGRNVCERCQRVRSVCPICLSLHGNNLSTDEGRDWGKSSTLWTFCHGCGHSGHVSCMKEWFGQPFSDGACPTQGCGCDCGPGVTRELRVQAQIKREEEVRLIRGLNANGGGSTKRDSLRAGVSPAVDKARAALRNSLAGERATQSGDERSVAGKRGSSRGRMAGFSSSRKIVRLVTPREESGEQPQP